MLKEADRKNFDTLQKAMKSGNLCLLEVKDKKTGEYVAVICAVNWEDGDALFIPLARMFNDNPYETLIFEV